MLENHSQATQWTALALRLLTAIAALALSLADRGGVFPGADVLALPLTLIGASNLAAAGAIMIPGLHNLRNMIQSAADGLTAGAASVLVYNSPLALLLLAVGIGGTGVNRWPWPWGCMVGIGVFAAVAVGIVLGHPEAPTRWRLLAVRAGSRVALRCHGYGLAEINTARIDPAFRKGDEQRDAD